MSVKYSLAHMSTKPGDKTCTEKKYYAKSQSASRLNIERICSNITHFGTDIRGDVLSVTDGLLHEMIRGLEDGQIVELGDFGHFQIQLRSEGTEKEKEFTAANIRKATIQFRPGPMLVKMLKGLTYERVAVRNAAAKEDSGDSNNGNSGNNGGENPSIDPDA